MAGIGTLEMCVIAIVALLVIGPDKLPEFAKVVMRIWRDLRRYSDEIRSEIEAPLFDLKDSIREARREILNPSSLSENSKRQLPEAVSGDDYYPYDDIEEEYEDIEAEYDEVDDSSDLEEDIDVSTPEAPEDDDASDDPDRD